MPRHILIKLTEDKPKERILKTARGKEQVHTRENPIQLAADLSVETLQARRKWQDISTVLKERKLQPSFLHLAKISLKTDGEIKSLHTSKN